MKSFVFVEPKSYEEAAAIMTGKQYSLPVLKGGGMDVLDHLKEGILDANALVNIKRLHATGAGTEPVVEVDGVIRIAASATMAQVAASPIVIKGAPAVAQALANAATPQVRNVATAAGNLLQRPRCWYYRASQFDCLKKGGSTCFSVDGENKFHAIFSPGPCHIVHPSNLAPALMVCDAKLHLVGSKRAELAIDALYHGPDKGLRSEHNLEVGEVITHITLKPRRTSGFYAIKEKQSFDWPLVFACVALELSGTKITSARVCAGAVAPVPWALPEVDKALAGVDVTDEKALAAACSKAADGAKPMRDNAYKVKLLSVAVKRAVLKAAGRPIPGEEAES